jgi:hypothetical protein
MIKTCQKGKVYQYNGIYVLCFIDLDPKNLNETPLFYGVVVETNTVDLVRATRDCFSKSLYSETNKTINDYKYLTDPNTGLWKKWFNKEYNEDLSNNIQTPTLEPDEDELELWNLESASGI